jgi:hypothetical protein
MSVPAHKWRRAAPHDRRIARTARGLRVFALLVGVAIVSGRSPHREPDTATRVTVNFAPASEARINFHRADKPSPDVNRGTEVNDFIRAGEVDVKIRPGTLPQRISRPTAARSAPDN